MAANRGGLEPGRARLEPGRGGLEPGRGGLEPGRARLEPGRRGPEPGRRSPGRSPGVQRRAARVTVKYNREELQRRLDTERWIDGRLAELYRGAEEAMPDELSMDELLQLPEPERERRLRSILSSCTSDPQEFIEELLAQLRGLPKRPPPKNEEPP